MSADRLLMPGAESTSARLARVENELTGVREELARQVAECEDLRATLAIRSRQIASARIELDHLRAERDAAYDAVLPANRPANRG